MLRLLSVALASWASWSVAQTAPKPDCWPKFYYKGVATPKDQMQWGKEWIFPSVFHAGEHFSEPLGEWYLYYAPHENPGGISLMYADDIEGPWTEYASNPLIDNKFQGKFDVPHTSSPDAIWNEETGKLFMYFHGDNGQTRWAWSTDGVDFTYGGLAVDNKKGGSEVTETSYARVFKHPDSSSGYGYGMFYMGNEKDNVRRIRLAESRDGKTWDVDPDYVVAPGSEEGTDVSGADLWSWNGQLYVIYHAKSGKIYARTIDSSLRNVGDRPILLHQSSGKGDDTGRVASPNIFVTDGWLYLFYEKGERLNARIAWGKASQDTSACGLGK